MLLNEFTVGKKATAVPRLSAPSADGLSANAQQLAAASWRLVKDACRTAAPGKLVMQGEHYLLEQPEFQQDVRELSRILSALSDAETMNEAMETEGRTAVRIGRENTSDALKKLAIVVSRFYINDGEAGTIAVAGPTRMRYASALPLVEAAANALTEALAKLSR
jgi:transcriptional regulator of heat shock response